MLNNAVVEVLASKMRVARRGQNLEDALVDRKHRDIKRSATKVVDEDGALGSLLVKAIRNGGGRRLIDDAEHVKASNSTGIFGGLTLGVVEVPAVANVCRSTDRPEHVRRDSYNGMRDILAEVRFGNFLHLGEDHPGNFLRGKNLVIALHLHLNGRLAILVDDLEWEVLDVLLNFLVREFTPDKSLCVEDGVGGVLRALKSRKIRKAEELLPFVVSKCYIGRGDAVSLVVGNDLHAAVFENGNAGICSPQVNADDYFGGKTRQERRMRIRLVGLANVGLAAAV
ncbi:MAG: NAD-specific glutamate dehydrogenase-domain-containing protein [Olpidium bornovanus]|uniref:NAD-specific glutamate dehydrogenase-domain-containing protein n=1 Tax=Olpidium bornovanus TaxID=278681 RepID=A0A8H8A217_9FUNG|nr:MAG: NAD-specific glutamate dehydrogenase-domain-containing protein [Olpidium bornovanus]